MNDVHLLQYQDLTGNQTKSLNKIHESLSDDIKRMKYENNKGDLLLDKHHGQRKLFMSEVDFFNKTYKCYKKFIKNGEKIYVLYIGAASGVHIVLLAKMYPFFEFHLYDTGKFDQRLYSIPNVKIFSKYFYENEAKDYDDKHVLFISDIRNLKIRNLKIRDDDNNFNHEQSDKFVTDDMILQMNIYYLLENPIAGMFKFRLPWENPLKLRYMDGEIRFGVWNGRTSTETRLIVYGLPKMKTYDCKKYEEQCFYHNKVLRNASYKNPAKKVFVCSCFDCVREATILITYLNQNKNFKLSLSGLARTLTKLLRQPIYPTIPQLNL